MELSVVIPTYKRPELLRRCLASLQQQDLDPTRFDVVIVDDGSGDATTDVLAAATRDVGNIVALTQPRNAGPAAARNRGIHTATGDLVLFLDDDVVAAPDLLSTHLAIHAQRADPLLGVLGRVDWDPALTVTPFMHWLDTSGLQFAYDTWLREGPVDPPYAAFYTANLSLRRDLLVAENGFDERFPYPAFEDIELAFRLANRGFHLDYQPSARGFHTRAMDLLSFANRMHKVGESAELISRAAPDFPLDDEQLAQQNVGAADLIRRAARAATGSKRGRASYYWAVVGRAYTSGRKQAARSAAQH
jgi:glycosyltransferase involved in cell wall biosynthesis